ncbi:TIGR00730 family Rossman fold protein [Pseudomonas paraversuta]|uniref:LOG family protein n=1 Tax=Pseudomonas paraversuta TaxID=2750624 RepID=UPI0002886FE3|nr:TIGR00730 family Rossman fold protein [Pseudomonas paraversuta]AMB78551.1 cytochrome D ubiquinol oxidase subunit II [Pseudomonas fragi]
MPDQPNEPLALLESQGLDLARQVDEQLQQIASNSPNRPLYREMILTILRMAHDDFDRWNAKITLQAIRELEKTFRVLEQFKGQRKVTVFGSARTPVEHPLYALARQVGATLAKSDFMVITGGGAGIMAAAHEGAGLEHSLGFNITLPFEQRANPTINGTANLLAFHFFFTRKLFFIKEADALVMCPGGFGTLDEVLEVLTLMQTGKTPLVPVVLLDMPGGTFWQSALDFIRNQLEAHQYILPNDLKLMRLVHTAEEAVAEINQFYSNFHSSRWLTKDFVIRMKRPVSISALQHIQQTFADICLSGSYVQQGYEGFEHEDPKFSHLTCLSFAFSGRNQGRLRELIDFINLPQNWAEVDKGPGPVLSESVTR